MNVSKFSKFSTNRHLLLVSFLLLQVTNVCTWKWAEDLEEYLKNGAQLQGMNFLASDDLWDKVCETGTCITSPLFTVDDMNGVERVKEEFKVTNISAWKGSAALELFWKNGIQFEGFDFLPYTMYYHAACVKGTTPSVKLYMVGDLLKGVPVQHKLTLTLPKQNAADDKREVSAIPCAQVGEDLYYVGQGPVQNSISVYKGSTGSNEVKCYGFIENFKFME